MTEKCNSKFCAPRVHDKLEGKGQLKLNLEWHCPKSLNLEWKAANSDRTERLVHMQTHIEIKKLFKNVSYELFLGQAWLPRKFWNILVLLSRSSHPWLLASPVLGGPEPKICWQTADSMRTNLPHWGAWGRCARNSKVLLRDSEILLRNGRRSMKKPGWSSLP